MVSWSLKQEARLSKPAYWRQMYTFQPQTLICLFWLFLWEKLGIFAFSYNTKAASADFIAEGVHRKHPVDMKHVDGNVWTVVIKSFMDVMAYGKV